jgi:hypothetical protein
MAASLKGERRRITSHEERNTIKKGKTKELTNNGS